MTANNIAHFGPLVDICVKESDTHGLGVFARGKIEADTVIERCAVLASMYQRTPGRPCAFSRYLYYAWADFPTVGFIPSGFGTMYNDGGMCCNVVYEVDMNSRCLSFTVIKDIEPGEELVIDYKQLTREPLKCSFI